MDAATETVSSRYRMFETWDDAAILAGLWEAQLAAAACVQTALPAIAAAAAASARRLHGAGRLVYAGAGTSGRLGVQDGVELEPTFGWPPERLVLLMAGGRGAWTQAAEGAEDDEPAAAEAVSAPAPGAPPLGKADVVVAVAASGRTPYTVALARLARSHGALTIGIANAPGHLLDVVDHAILADTGPEMLAGSTRLKAGTAQKIVLNLFSTLLMTRLGGVHDGRMVRMRVSNEKLRRRAVGMVAELADCAPDAAARALSAAADRIELAVLLAKGLAVDVANSLLCRHDGLLRPALREAARLASGGAA